MPIIDVVRNKSKVEIHIASYLPHDNEQSGARIPFSFEVVTAYSAELMARYIRNLIHVALKTARQESYEQGWKDAKSHKTKKDWFSGNL